MMNSSKPLISIALPFYNAESTLAETLQSIQTQSYQEFEVLLIDDGSADRSLEIARSFDDPRFSIFFDGHNRGLAERLNECAQRASGRFLARMDADDLMHPERLQRQLAELLRDPLIDLLGSDAWIIDSRSRTVGYQASQNPSIDPWWVVRNGLFIHSSVIGKIEWFRANPYSKNVHRAEDLELWVRACAHSRFAVMHEPLIYYRRRNPWHIAPEMASAMTVDKLILTWGQKTSHDREARTYVRQRKLRRVRTMIGTFSGLRWLKWEILSMCRQKQPVQPIRLVVSGGPAKSLARTAP